MRGAGGPGDGDIEALVVDRYLESLLTRGPVDAEGVPVELRATASRLTGALPRFHPSFRFEEALAARLAVVAGRIQAGDVVALPPVTRGEPSDAVVARGRARPVVIGGVVTSAALSLAGAAYVAWRLRQPPDPMTRAVRAVARARLT